MPGTMNATGGVAKSPARTIRSMSEDKLRCPRTYRMPSTIALPSLLAAAPAPPREAGSNASAARTAKNVTALNVKTAVTPTAVIGFLSVSYRPIKTAKAQHKQYFSALDVPTRFV